MGETEYRLRGKDARLSPTHWRMRLRCFTFQWFTMIMGTGGFDFILSQINVRYGGHWLIVLGDIIYIFNIVCFVTFTVLIIARFIIYPPSMKHVWLHPQESSFLPTFPLAMATLILSAAFFGTRDTGPWLIKTCEVFWWIYVAMGLTLALVVPLLQWTVQKHPLEDFVPIWLFPPLGIVFSAAVVYQMSMTLPAYTSVYLIITAYILVGFGIFTALVYGTIWVARLISFGAPPPMMATVFFIWVGPIAWGSYGLIALGSAAQMVFPLASDSPTPFLGSPQAGTIFSIASLCLGLVFYGLSWFITGTALLYFLVSVFKRQVPLSGNALNNWALTFPLTGHIGVAFILGTRFPSRFFTDLAIVQSCIWIVLWFFALGTTINGVIRGEICAEGKDANLPAFGFQGDYEVIDKDGRANGDVEQQ